MTFAMRLSSLRKTNNISQLELASNIGISDRTVGMWERGLSAPNAETAIKLADYFDVSIDYLLCRDKETAFPSLDQNLISIQRAYEKLNPEDQKKMLEMNKLMFKAAFEEEANDDTI